MTELVTPVAERRKHCRFPIDAELRWQVWGAKRDKIRGTGQVENISSKSVAFRADGRPSPQRKRLRVSLAWPAKIGDTPLRLAFEGKVLRAQGNLVVVSIVNPEFRTAGRAPLQPMLEASASPPAP